MRPAPSRRAVLIGGGAAATLWPPAVTASSGESFAQIEKSVWVWRIEVDGLPALADFATAHGIRRVLLSFRAPARAALMAGEAAALRQMEAFRARGIAAGALTGDPSWPTRPNHMPRSLEEWIGVQERRRLFDFLHLDVEPHSLPAWRTGGAARETLMRGMLDFLGNVRDRIGEWPLDAALHPQYARLELTGGRNFMVGLLERLDSVALMAYRDDAARLADLALPSIRLFEEHARPWRLGILVHADKEAGVSYWRTSRTHLVGEMNRLLRLVEQRSAPRRFQGLVFEDFDGLRTILERR